MNLYDLNCSAYGSLPNMEEKELSRAENVLKSFLDKTSNRYYALICNENKYYTVFTYQERQDNGKMSHEIIDVAQSLGNLKSIETNSEQTGIEFWISNELGCHMYMFMPYDLGVITV